ncbi:MAG: tRNA pseudouridine(13) synthase TruD [Thermoplasmata archaeon]|nr:tRNA pseudouridine(13) synthase TruD [Thermoplasmata archaeon]NIS10677.1 tRNA pseudouridine(13) synthase TruD [Thermoplasmata archaeon]NIS18628.1 tRNA pseudouridine(13) synthase TruD [Thermoplasmata archaeon]NIT75629.1 tRNA pseudouridine(13) synthase TruD [Thermoplasmata archaeon]NIU47781.1 tRNA pseudouridine(13) synthase TruD [Thermoplasmata archaeon]
MTSLLVPDEPTGEEEVGMLGFLTPTAGIGGRLRAEVEDFVVVEESRPPAEVPDGRFTAATITLHNWETNRFVRQMSRRLGISSKRVRFAGTKDKRAVTTQLFTLEADVDSVRALRMADVEVRDLFPTDRHVSLGQLVANRFSVTVSDTGLDEAELRDRTSGILEEAAAEGGFPNFYGHQRFGVQRPVSHLVGEQLVRGDPEGAVWTYLTHPGPGEDEGTREARRELAEGRDVRQGLRRFPPSLGNERSLLEHLLHDQGDHEGAFRRLPFNLQLMFVHAYQGLAFNRVVSERMRRGLSLVEPVEGDVIVPVDEHGNPRHDRPVAVTGRNLAKVAWQVGRGHAAVTGAVPGTEAPLAEGEMGDIEASVLQGLRVTREDFHIVGLTELTTPGIRRELAIAGADPVPECGDGRVTLTFRLQKGCYATCVLREVMKAPMLSY